MSLETLYRERYDASVKQMKARTGCLQDAEDIVQDAFERCVRYEKTIGNVENCFPMILKNCYRDWTTVSRRQGMSVTDPLEHGEDDFPDVSFDANIEYVKELVSKKKGKYGEIISLLVTKGYTQEEVSIMFNLTTRTIEGYINKFKKELAKEK